MVWLVLEHTNINFEHFESDFKTLQLGLGLMRESASFLGKSSKLMFLHLDSNTTKTFQINYRRTLWDLKYPNIHQTLNVKSENSF